MVQIQRLKFSSTLGPINRIEPLEWAQGQSWTSKTKKKWGASFSNPKETLIKAGKQKDKSDKPQKVQGISSLLTAGRSRRDEHTFGVARCTRGVTKGEDVLSRRVMRGNESMSVNC